MTTIRPATPSDAAAILRIYAPVVRETAISFELEPPTTDEMEERIAAMSASHLYLAAEQGGELVGYAYANAFRPRPAYARTCEVTAYVDPSQRGCGVGRSLYHVLLPGLAKRGFRTGIAVITLPNDASIALHEAFGFRKVGVLPEVGHKLGAWHDTGWWSLSFKELTE